MRFEHLAPRGAHSAALEAMQITAATSMAPNILGMPMLKMVLPTSCPLPLDAWCAAYDATDPPLVARTAAIEVPIALWADMPTGLQSDTNR